MLDTILNPFQKVGQGTRQRLGRWTERLGNTTLLEKVGLLAIFVLIMNALFSVDIRVTRKPLLNAFLGTKQRVASAPPAPTPQSTSAADKASTHNSSLNSPLQL